MDSQDDLQGRHLVVIGGGIGGLLSAKLLAPRFDWVTVLERDRYPETAAARRGVPQGRCLHMLMAKGQEVFERLVPGWSGALQAAGAVPFDVGKQGALRLADGWLPRTDTGIEIHACSRGLLEEVLRKVVQTVPNVTIETGRSVQRFVCRPQGHRVTSVWVSHEGQNFEMPADLTVVATGRGSIMASWLADAGCPEIPKTVVRTRRQSVSRWYARPEAFDEDWKLLSIAPTSDTRCGGTIIEAERQTWGVVLSFPDDEPAPTTDSEFLDLCARLPDERLRKVLQNALPKGPIVRHQRDWNRVYHFEQLDRWPEGLVAVGDAVCMLDPYFGLGMTACALGVEKLARHDWIGSNPCHRFQEALAEQNQLPWSLTTGAWRAGRTSASDTYYLQYLQRLAFTQPAIQRLLLQRMHLLTPPNSIWRPEVMAQMQAPAGSPP